jgi:DNA-binding beta-propeller fold protein YncE
MKKATKIRSKSNLTNLIESDMIIVSGKYKYKFSWNWAKLPEDMKLTLISGVTCDKEGNVYALNRSEDYPIVVFDKDGNLINRISIKEPVKRVHGACMTSDEKIWFADDGGHVVRKIDKEGNVIMTIGEFGKPSDTGCNNALPSPELAKSIKYRGLPFNRPTKAFETDNGNIYVSDGYANVAIHKFDKDGNLIKSWGAVGNGDNEFRRPHGIWVDKFERVWVADRENDTVKIFNSEGEFIHRIDDLLFPTDFWSDGNLMYVGELDGRLSIFDLEFKLVAQLGFAGSPLCVHALYGMPNGDLFACVFRGEYYLVKLERIWD